MSEPVVLNGLPTWDRCMSLLMLLASRFMHVDCASSSMLQLQQIIKRTRSIMCRFHKRSL